MHPQLLFVLLVLSGVQIGNSQESAQYLQSAMWNLGNRVNGNTQTKRRMDSLQIKKADSVLQNDGGDNVPMLSLTKGELAALYEAALTKQGIVPPSSNHEDASYINPGVQELDESESSPQGHKTNGHEYSDSTSGDGYYYYYYPINSFLDDTHHSNHDHITPDSYHSVEPEKLHAQYHSHTHQHNVHITSMKGHDNDKKKVMEPLFMAVSSFIGMAVMFVLSILFLPKFGVLKSRGTNKATAGEVTNFAHIIYKAIEGDDCSERVVCELGKAAKILHMHDNRFVKLFRRITPAYVGWYVDGIGKYADTNLTCAAIQCRRKNQKQKPLRKKLHQI